MIRNIICVMTGLILLSACSGRTAMPVSNYKYGDDKLSCADLRGEAAKSEREVLKLYSEKNDAHGDNVALGVVGGLLFWPALFALDTSDAEKVEIQSHKDRIESLQRIMAQKNCGRYDSKIEQIERDQRKQEKSKAAEPDKRIDQ